MALRITQYKLFQRGIGLPCWGPETMEVCQSFLDPDDQAFIEKIRVTGGLPGGTAPPLWGGYDQVPEFAAPSTALRKAAARASSADRTNAEFLNETELVRLHGIWAAEDQANALAEARRVERARKRAEDEALRKAALEAERLAWYGELRKWKLTAKDREERWRAEDAIWRDFEAEQRERHDRLKRQTQLMRDRYERMRQEADIENAEFDEFREKQEKAAERRAEKAERDARAAQLREVQARRKQKLDAEREAEHDAWLQQQTADNRLALQQQMQENRRREHEAQAREQAEREAWERADYETWQSICDENRRVHQQNFTQTSAEIVAQNSVNDRRLAEARARLQREREAQQYAQLRLQIFQVAKDHQAYTVVEIADVLGIDADVIERALERMVADGYVRKVEVTA